MIHASRAMSAERVADYFRREYSCGDYYTRDRTAPLGTWQGRGAARLGLAGAVAADDFHALLAGRSPRDGRQLVAPEAASGKHRAGWDFEVSPDKSVSVVALVGGDDRIVAAHLAAARRAYDLLEDHAWVKDSDRDAVPSRNMVIARFDHDASRALDPHLHSHHVFMNLTERAPGEWRALESRGLYRAQRLATAAYRVELARELQALGYDVRANAEGNVRIAGVPEEVVTHFSKRRRQIQAEAARRRAAGLPVDLARIALLTRAPKDHDVDPAALRASWRADTARLGLDLGALRRTTDERRAAGLPRPELDPSAQARASAAWAIAHLSERQASFRDIDLQTFALRHAAARGPGLDDILAALAGHPDLIEGSDGRLTTVAALRLEQANLARVRAGLLPSAPPILARPFDPGPTLSPGPGREHESGSAAAGLDRGPDPASGAAAGPDRSPDRSPVPAGTLGPDHPGPAPAAGPALGPDQLRVVRHILESRAQLLAVEGKPGTGKTFTLKAVRDAAEKAGWTVRGFAVTTGAVAQLREVGIEADTLQSLAAHPPEPPGGTRPLQLWIVDEASLLPNRLASTALESAHRAGARLVLVGDSGQHHAVEAGAPWRAFQTAGLRPVQLDLIRRQQHTDLLAAVQLSSTGRAADAVRLLDDRGRVVEIASTRERHAAMVAAFALRPDRTLMIAPSRDERRDLNFLARQALVAAGRVAPEGASVEIAVSKGLTSAERADVRHYEAGDLAIFVRAAPTRGLRAGDAARVLAVDRDRHSVRAERLRDGVAIAYDPRRLRGGDLAKVETRQLSPGDRIQFRRADRARGISNGATARVREADASGRVVLRLDGRRGRILTLQPRAGPHPLDYAYAVTSHAAQGSTVRRVLATIDTRHSAELVNRQQANVTLSRASHELTVYTNDRAALPSAVDRQSRKTTALEVLSPPRRRRHAPSPPARASNRRSGRPIDTSSGRAGASPGRAAAAAERAAAPDRAPGAASERSRPPAPERPRRAAAARRAPSSRAGAAAERGPAPHRRPRARASGRADRAGRPRDPRPRPHPFREPRQKPRRQPEPERARRAFRDPERSPSFRHGGRPRDPRDPGRARAEAHRSRPLADPLASRLIRAAERWLDAPAAPAAGHSPASAPRTAGPRLGAVLAAAGLVRAATRGAAALSGREDAERHLVRLMKEIGVQRALSLLPPPLARAVQGIREVARLVADLARDR
jgi:conjugative relaxase-like TrwC/TraI family protein